METYAWPTIGDLAVDEVATDHVLAVLRPIWATKAETAGRVRGRTEAVLDYATARTWRTGDNPARWRGHLKNLLVAHGKVSKVRHHPALPWSQVGEFVAELREEKGTTPELLLFTILTATRSKESYGVRWRELNLDLAGWARDGAVWTVPAERMKAEAEHRVPLPAAAVKIARRRLPADGSPPDPDALVFPGERPKKPLSVMAMLMLLRRMNPVSAGMPLRWRDGRTGEAITVHGFRSTFRDWAAEHTNFPRELAEAALAHTLPGKVEGAYQRGDMLWKRRVMMDAWAAFCAEPMRGGDVVPIRAA